LFDPQITQITLIDKMNNHKSRQAGKRKALSWKLCIRDAGW